MFPLFGTGRGISKNLSHYLEQERETQKSVPAVWELKFKAFLLGNIREREFPLMPEGKQLTRKKFILAQLLQAAVTDVKDVAFMKMTCEALINL